MFSATETAAAWIEEDERKRRRIAVIRLSDFSPQQVRRFLILRGKDGFAVRNDILDTLKRPILANMYAQLEGAENWKPENEYALFDRFWKHIGRSPEAANDSIRLVRLADSLLEGDVYPWPEGYVADRLGDAVWSRLEKAGWLDRSNGNVRFRHDRFLNWATAKAMVERFRAGRWSLDALGTAILETYTKPQRQGEPELGYVAMDVLWLGATERWGPKDLAAIAEKLEGADQHVYGNVGTLGALALPMLIARLEMLGDGDAWVGYEVTQTIRRIDRVTPLGASKVLEMLLSPSRWVQDVGLALAAQHPDPSYLDQIWNLRTARANSESDPVHEYLDDKRLTIALVAAARLKPAWLRDRIERTDDDNSLRPLLTALAALGTSAARQAWWDVRDHVFASEPKEALIAAAHCIERFRDQEQVERLEKWSMTGSGLLAGFALQALAELDRQRALRFLRTRPLTPVAFNLYYILRPLMMAAPDETLRAVREAIADDRLSRREIEFAFGNAHQLDPPTIDALLLKLGRAIEADPDGEQPGGSPGAAQVEHYVAALNTVNSVGGLAHLTSLANSEAIAPLERYFSGRARRSTRTPNFFLEDAQNLLLRIGGPVLSRFLETRLTNPGEWPGPEILEIASSPTAEAMVRIHELLPPPAPDGAEGSARSVRQACIETIAGVEGRESAIRALQASHGLVTDRVVSMLDTAAPVSDEFLAALIPRLDAEESRVSTINVLALSGRPDVIPRLVEEALISPDSNRAASAITSIRTLVTRETPVSQISHLGFDRFAESTLRILLQIDTPEAIELIVAYLRSDTNADARSYSTRVAAHLIEERGLSELASIVWDRLLRSARYFWGDLFWIAVGHIADEEAEEALITRSFGTDGMAPSMRAIRGLAVRHPETAFAAAKKVLEMTGKGRASIVDLLFEIDESQAPQLLLSHVPSEANALVRAFIGRACRRRGSETMHADIDSLLQGKRPEERAAGAQLAGFLDDFQSDRLRRLASEEMDPMVRALAMGAASAQKDRGRVAELLHGLESAVGSQAWSLVRVIVETGDALLLVDPQDPLCLQRHLAGKPAPLTIDAKERMSARWKKYVEKMDQDMRDDYYL